MTPRWIGCAPQNVHPGRPADLTPSAIVLHRSGGSLSDLRARFAEPTSSLSAHYAVGLDGSIDQYVAEADTAFHAGVVVNPSWPGLKEKVNPNLYTFAIEHEGSAAGGWPDVSLPSDLHGITTATYDPAETNSAASLGPPCNKIREAIRATRAAGESG